MTRERRPRGVVDDPPPPPDNYPATWPEPDAPIDPTVPERGMTGRQALVLLVGLIAAVIVLAAVISSALLAHR